ncbi:hypothetical protein D1818_19545 [Aquimarina sp. BL5]|nr:hypothetical protein D1818_19545 [Aquimarina sp. BL5]RKN02276.1 hypothetical protein D7036_16670 [Aquimarina sp. BL5]
MQVAGASPYFYKIRERDHLNFECLDDNLHVLTSTKQIDYESLFIPIFFIFWSYVSILVGQGSEQSTHTRGVGKHFTKTNLN